MKKKRIIKIMNPCLVQLRNSFRSFIIRVVNDEFNALSQLMAAYYDEVEIDRNKIQSIVDEKNSLRRALRGSICQCAACSDSKKDHIYNPNEKKWYCEECYGILKKSYTEVDKMPKWFP